MARKQTKDERIKELEQMQRDALETMDSMRQTINRLQAGQDQAFTNSAMYLQMQAEIDSLQAQRNVDRTIIEQRNATIAELRAEVSRLQSQQTGQPVHNARGAGRKPDLAKRQHFAQLYAAGASMEQIMADMQIGRRTYYRYKAAYTDSDNN